MAALLSIILCSLSMALQKEDQQRLYQVVSSSHTGDLALALTTQAHVSGSCTRKFQYGNVCTLTHPVLRHSVSVSAHARTTQVEFWATQHA